MWFKLIGLSSVSGLLLFFSDCPLHLWPLQLLALVPFLYTLERVCRSYKTAALAGLMHGLCYLVPLEIASPQGEILAQMDHFAEGPGLIVADVPLYEGGTLYSKLGDWLVALCLVLILIGAILRRRAFVAR